MHIVFWSCMPGHGNVTSNLLSIACDCAAYQRYFTSVLQTQFKKNNLQYPFFKIEDKANVEQYNSVGMDSLVRAIKGGSISGGIETAAVSFMDSKLSVYTQSTNFDGKAYYNSLLQTMSQMMKSLDATFDLSFIDTAGGNDPVSFEALKNADYIVICLPQEQWIVNYQFSKYQFEASKVFYLIGNYDPKSVITLKSLQKSKAFKGKFTSKNCAYIAHDIDFANALSTSDLESFFISGMNCKPSNPNYEYFKSVHEATKKLLTFVGITPRK